MSVRADPDAIPPAAGGTDNREGPAASYRGRRRESVAEARRRRELLIAQAPDADAQFVNAIAASDSFWGPDERWRTALHSLPTDPPQPVDHQPAATSEPHTTPGSRPTRSGSFAERLRGGAGRSRPTDGTSFDVPLPSRPTRGVGRTRSWVIRLALIVGPLLMVGGLTYSCGVSTGSSRLVQQAAISSQDAAVFHLSSFPAERASAFGVTYLTMCWTHPSATDSAATQNRLASLAQMSSAGVTPGCGWTGTAPSPAPLAITWDGSATPIPGAYTDGEAAQLGFVVTTVDQRTIGVTVPIWMPSTTSMAGARVVGDVAVVPVATAAAAPTPIAPTTTDSAVADALTRSVLLPFLRAWAASDPVQLNLVLARDASSAARTGMAGQLFEPAVTGVRVVVTRGDPTAYRDGDQITAQITVDWTTTSGGQRSGYSVGLRMTAGRWQVTDISGAAPDPAGGLAPSTTFATPASTPPPAG